VIPVTWRNPAQQEIDLHRLRQPKGRSQVRFFRIHKSECLRRFVQPCGLGKEIQIIAWKNSIENSTVADLRNATLLEHQSSED
jgi:hypothetical protein